MSDICYSGISELHAQIERLADEALLAGHGSEAEKRYFHAFKQLEIRSRVTPDQMIECLIYDVASRVEESNLEATVAR